jgi:hypothetical protein
MLCSLLEIFSESSHRRTDLAFEVQWSGLADAYIHLGLFDENPGWLVRSSAAAVRYVTGINMIRDLP